MTDFSPISFQPWALVALAMALLTAFVAVDLHCRSIESRTRAQRHWLLSTGVALGTGHWCVLALAVAIGPAHGAASFHAGELLGLWALSVVAAIAAAALHTTGKGAREVSSARLAAAAGLGGLGMSATALTLVHDASPRSPSALPVVAAAGVLAVFGLAGLFALLHPSRRGRSVPRGRRLAAMGWLAGALLGMFGLLLWLGHQGDPLPATSLALHAMDVGLVASVGGLAMVGTIASAIVAQAHLQHSLRSANEALERQTVTDLLTDLPNRQVFDQALAKAAEEAHREKQSLAVLCVNLDGFKPVNERLGHKLGDQLLRETARRLKEFFGADTLVARAGADEFVVLVRRGVSQETMKAIASQLLDRLSAPMRAGETTLKLPGSVGIALYPEHGSAPTLIAHAEAAMRTAKLQGGATYCLFQRQMLEGAREQAELLRDLKFALSTRQLELYYQPKIDAPSGQITGCEALLRWNHPKRGPVSPSLFIPLAEENGLINMLGQWVIEAVCEQIAAWRQAGLQMRVAVNLSVHQLRQPGLAGQIAEALKRNAVEPRLLTCEITESVAMGDAQESIQLLNRLAAVGVHLSIDDFGTGYSSLAYLRKLPAEELKIDRSFVLDLETSEDARSVVDAVVRLAKALDLKVVAEGVETEEQARILRDMGCAQLQGHLFAKPMSANALTVWAMHREGPAEIPFRESLYQATTLMAEV